jgi:hypothetical protein
VRRRDAIRVLAEELIRTLRPPPFCYTAVNGEPAEPCVSKFKQAPSDKVAMKIARLVAEERPCWIFNRKCARMNFTDTTGKPYWQKFNKVGAPLLRLLRLAALSSAKHMQKSESSHSDRSPAAQ